MANGWEARQEEGNVVVGAAERVTLHPPVGGREKGRRAGRN